MKFRDRFDRRKRQPSTRKQRIGFAFFWLVLLTYAYVIATFPNANAESHLYLTYSIVDRHSVNIDPYTTRLVDESHFRGHYYSDKAPGISLLAVPLYAAIRHAVPAIRGEGYVPFKHQKYAIRPKMQLLRYVITYILVSLPAALFAVLFWLFMTRFSSRAGWTLIVAGAYALGTIAFRYSTLFFSHQIAALLLFGAFMLLYDALHRDDSGLGSPGRVLLSGLLIGYAVISEYPAVVIGILLAVYAACLARRRVRTLALLAAGALPAAGIGMVYDLLAFGKPFATGYNHVDSVMYHNQVHGGFLGMGDPSAYGVRAPQLSSLWEITFGLYRGIFPISPVLLLFFPALYFMWKRRAVRAELLLCAAVVVLYFLMDASRPVSLNGWSGGASVASRHLTPILPFMMFPVVFALESRAFRYALAALGSISIAIMSAIIATSGTFDEKIHNPLKTVLWHHIQHAHLLVNWGNVVGLKGVASLVPYAVIAAMLCVRIVRQVHAQQRPARVSAHTSSSPLSATSG